MNQPLSEFSIGNRMICESQPTYFIADVAANHDGDLERAKDLICLCAESGADAAKFQHFAAETIVSDYGFRALGSQQSHQAKWNKSVFEVYKDASIDHDWTSALAETCKKAGIDFLTSPYSFELVDLVDPYVAAHKVGSGDITWLEIIRYMACKNKPLILATGASTSEEVSRAVEAAVELNPQLALMQCNSNYTGSLENFKYIQLNVIKGYAARFPGIILGLSDHTSGHATVLGAVALGARMIEKHFTDSNDRKGPDHTFSMNPTSWRDMVDRTRELEAALGNGVKKVEDNERETVVLQRRALRAARRMKQGERITAQDITPLRPCPAGAISPASIEQLMGKALSRDIDEGDFFQWKDLR